MDSVDIVRRAPSKCQLGIWGACATGKGSRPGAAVVLAPFPRPLTFELGGFALKNPLSEPSAAT